MTLTRRLTAAAIAGVCAAAVGLGTAVPSTAAEQVTSTPMATGLTSPWGLAFLPDGSALVSERDTGLIKRVPAKGGRTTTVGRVPGVRASGEGGLLGIAVPEGPDPRYLFAYYTGDRDNRVVRISWDGTRLGRQTPIVTGIPKNTYHNGGRIIVGPQDTLLIGTGDAGDPALSQDPRSLAGKILRVTSTGKPAPGNPDPDSPVYSLGHRNVQGLAFDDAGRLWATEFGERKADELNLIRPGANYGWPTCEGRCSAPGLESPKVTWSPTSTASPSGMAISGNTAYVASLRGEVLWQVPLQGTQARRPTAASLGSLGRLRTVEAAPDGSLWLITSNTDGRGDPRPGDDRILRLSLRGQ